MPKRKRVRFEEPEEISAPGSFGREADSGGRKKVDYGEVEYPENSLVSDPSLKPETITAFNLVDELEEGSLDKDEDVGFVPERLRREVPPSPKGSSSDEEEKKNSNSEGEEEDEWLKGLQVGASYNEGGGASSNKRMRMKNSESLQGEVMTGELFYRLWTMLRPQEDALAAIRRMKREEEVTKLEVLTEICDDLMGKGILKVYDMSRDNVGENLTWTLRWDEETEVHGPFSTKTMVQWSKAGYFSKGVKPAYIRCLSGNKGWQSAVTVFREN